MSPVDLLRWLASAPPPEEAAAVARACLDYVAGVAVQAAPAVAAAQRRAVDAEPITPATAARELEVSRNLPRRWLALGLVDGWDAVAQTAPRGSWREAQRRAPKRGRPRKQKEQA